MVNTSLDIFDGATLPAPSGPTTVRVDATRVEGIDVPALFPDTRNSAPLVREFASGEAYGLRHQTQTDQASQSVDPLMTEVVLGTPYLRRNDWVNGFFPPTRPLPVDGATGLATSKAYRYMRWGNGHLADYDTLLPERAPFALVGLSHTLATETIDTYGLAADLTKEEQSLAARDLNWAARKASLPMFVMERRMAFQAAERLLDTAAEATYATGHVINLAPGAEWDNGGDLEAEVQALGSLILNKVTGDWDQLTLRLTTSSYRAALKDAGYKAQFSGVTTLDRKAENANLAALARYLGIGRVERINPTGEKGVPIFGDLAWLYLDSPGSEYSTDYGWERWAARFAPSRGVILPSWYDDMHRVRYWAAMMQYKHTILNPACAGLITNCSKE